MPQAHNAQQGTFHVTTVTHRRIKWCSEGQVPRSIIDNLHVTKTSHKAEIYAFCILPDHVHILLKPGEGGLSKFMQSFKRHSGWNAKEILHRIDVRWQKGFHDERVRDAKQREEVKRYIEYNPLRHNLVEDIEHWPWTSLHYPEILDAWEMWFD